MLWVPRARVVTESAAAPALTVAVPRVAEPSLNVTEPVAVAGATVAVSVTAAPCTEGLGVAVSVVVVVCCCGELTLCPSAIDVAGAFDESPP